MIACDALDKGGVVALPTDTIYGVATKVSMTAGIQRLYNLKGRDKNKPLAICCSEISQISRYVIYSCLFSTANPLCYTYKLV